MNNLAASLFKSEPMLIDGKPNPNIICEKKKIDPWYISRMEQEGLLNKMKKKLAELGLKNTIDSKDPQNLKKVAKLLDMPYIDLLAIAFIYDI